MLLSCIGTSVPSLFLCLISSTSDLSRTTEESIGEHKDTGSAQGSVVMCWKTPSNAAIQQLSTVRTEVAQCFQTSF